MEVIKPNLSFSQWRKKTISMYYIIVAAIFLIETFVYIAFRSYGLVYEGYTDLNYISDYIILPTTINIFIVFICHMINRLKISDQIKNYALVLTLSVISSVMAFIHYDVLSVLSVFALPVFLTALFGQKKMTSNIALINLVLLILSIIHSAANEVSLYFFLNISVAFMLLLASYLISSIFITYHRANSDYIYASYITQLSLNKEAQNDSLTGLYNQKSFHVLLNTSLEQSRKTRSPMSLAIIDLDYFKEINDNFGHQSGDSVLINFSTLLKKQFSKEESHISRYGGDEFAVIFLNASKEMAYLKLESLRQHCNHPVTSNNQAIKVGFSAGISHYLEGEIDEALLFHQADTALYHAKAHGRGQTAVYSYSD